MQGDAIVNRILVDADIKAQEKISQAQTKASEILAEAQNFVEQKNQQVLEQLKLKEEELVDRYKTLAKIEGNKIVINKKQQIIEDLKNKALSYLLSQDKETKLTLVTKLLTHNAAKGEVLKFNIEGLTVKDVEGVDVVKKLALKVVADKEMASGIVLSNSTMDKNLLLKDLLALAYEQCQEKVNFLLFG